MSLIETLLSSAGGDGLVKQLAGQFGLNADQVTSAVTTLAPALAGGLKTQLEGGSGSGLLELITGGTLQKFASDPATLATPAAMEQGKSLVNMIFGGGNALTNVISMATEKTGLGSGVIQSLLPILATIVTGYLSKQSGGNRDELMNSLGSLAGTDGIIGTVKGLAAKIFG